MDGMGQYSKNTLGHPHVLRRNFLHHQQLWTFEVYYWDTFFATPRPQHFLPLPAKPWLLGFHWRHVSLINFVQSHGFQGKTGRPWLSDSSKIISESKFSHGTKNKTKIFNYHFQQQKHQQRYLHSKTCSLPGHWRQWRSPQMVEPKALAIIIWKWWEMIHKRM